MGQAEKESRHRWAPVVIACALLIGTAMWGSTLLPADGGRAAVGEMTAVADFPRLLTVRDGQLVLTSMDGGQVLERYAVYAATLPTEEQEKLTEGVTVTGEEELAELLENYTS